jgi:hypothetical protein
MVQVAGLTLIRSFNRVSPAAVGALVRLLASMRICPSAGLSTTTSMVPPGIVLKVVWQHVSRGPFKASLDKRKLHPGVVPAVFTNSNKMVSPSTLKKMAQL